MTSEKKRRLEMTVAAIRQQWGTRAIRRARQTPATIPHISPSFASLDEALGIGGIPRGRITEIAGAPTSGMATTALKILANAQAGDGTAIYLDLDRTFDPHYAARCGLDLTRLLIVHPYDERQALAILQDFILGGGASAVVFDIPYQLLARPQQLGQALATTLGRLIAPLAKTAAALIFLTALPPRAQSSLDRYPDHLTIPHYATVRLFIDKERWLYQREDIRGYQAQVHVVKNKLGPAGAHVSIAITFNGTVA